jgi:hypothetical protein
MAKAWQKFKEDYNYNSSISNAISIKYKLYGAGLSLDDHNVTAERFADILKNDPQQRNALIALEHQRWNCEKICDGYTPLTDLDLCVEGGTHDKKAKKHICLVRSRAEAPLCDDFWSYERWDTNADLKALDPLDQISVRLHQKYMQRANEIKKSVSLFDDTMQRLKMIANKKEASGIAFSEWFSTLSLIWSGVRSALREYKPLKEDLIQAFKDFDTDDKHTAVGLVEIIDKRFSVILKSMEYTDWKKIDARLVDYIPFILTNKKNIHLAIPFSTGNNTQIFCNVAAPTVVNPTQVTYVHHFANTSDIAPFNEAIKYIFNYLPQKDICVKLNFVLSYKKNVLNEKNMEKLKTKLEESPYTQRVILLDSADEYEIAQNIIMALDEKLHVDAIEQNSTPLSYLLMGAGVYRNHPKYSFDINKKRFDGVAGCDYLKYIKSAQYLRVSDIFACKSSKGVIESPLAFYKDYEKLWKKMYRGQEWLWKMTCGLLSQYHANESFIKIGADSIKEKGKIEKYRYLVPAAAFTSVKAIIDYFVEAKVFEQDSSVSFYTPDSCEVIIFASDTIKDIIGNVFSNISLLIGHVLSIEVIYDTAKLVINRILASVHISAAEACALQGAHSGLHKIKEATPLGSLGRCCALCVA